MNDFNKGLWNNKIYIIYHFHGNVEGQLGLLGSMGKNFDFTQT